MSTIIKALEGFEELGKSNSRLWKLAVLRKYSSNYAFRALLQAAYDPFRVYNVKKFELTLRTSLPSNPLINYENFMNLLEDLHNRVITGNEALTTIDLVFSRMSDLEIEWYTRVLKKDLNVGIQAKTINEAIPGLIPTFGVMLAQPFRSYPNRFVVQPKFDGMRILGSTTTGKLYSRKGKLVEGFDEVEEQLRRLPSGFFIDGEILSGAKGKKIESFNSLMTQAFRKSAGKKGLLFAFDIISEGTKQVVEIPLHRRVLLLDEVLTSTYEPLTAVRAVSTSEVFKKEESHKVEDLYDYYLSQGFEGIMIKDWDAPYEFKRSYNWQKLKPEETFDLVVVGIEPGNKDTKYEDQVGRLVCDFNGIEVRVGSGLTDEERRIWYESPELIVGKTVEIMAQEITVNKQGTSSLRFPRFKRIRYDK
jgi:DNA ligase-1